jgi:hypothetical protein
LTIGKRLERLVVVWTGNAPWETSYHHTDEYDTT